MKRFASYTDATFNANTISFNTAGEWGGGGVTLYRSNATLGRNTVTANTSDYYGGGLLSLNSDLTFNADTFASNTADIGGGIALVDSSGILMNSIIADNRADRVGSGLVIEGSSLSLLHTTIVRNHGGDGSGVYVKYSVSGHSTVALTNTILVRHTIGIIATTGNTATLEATLWGTNTWANETDWGGTGTVITGTVNVWGAPAFVNPDAGDYHIGPGSAAVDAGVDAGVTVDIDGQTRPQGAGYDLGADEYWPLKYVYLPLVLRNYP